MTPDSGTTFMTMPSWALNKFVDKTFKQDFSCSDNLEQFGTLTFVINGLNYDLEPHHWMRRRTDSKNLNGGKCSNMFRAQDI